MKNVATVAVTDQGLPASRRETRVSQALDILSYVILMAGLGTIGLAGYLVLVSYSSLPLWDGWIQIHFAADHGAQSTLAWIWNQHYDHRLVVPKLFLLADLHWFHARQSFLLASIFVIQLLHLLLWAWSMRVLGGWGGSMWRTGFGVIAFCLFCPSQWENLTWGFQTCFVLPGLFATLSFVGLLLYWIHSEESASKRAYWKYIVLSIAGALGATYSLSNGNLVWPLLVGAALLLRVRLSVVTSLIMAGATSTAFYLDNYVRRSTAILSPETLSNLLKYLAAYFGSSWVQTTGNIFRLPTSTIHLAEVIGIAGLAIALFALLQIRSYIRSQRAFCIQLVLAVLFCIGTGMVTALGRSFLGVGQAFASRYQTVSLLFWCCLALLWLAAALRSPRYDLLLAQVVLLCVLVFGGRLAQTTLTRARLQGFQRNLAGMALVTDVDDMEQLRWADYHPEEVVALAPFMRSERLSVFSGLESSLLGKPLNSEFDLTSPKDCEGKIESARVITNASPGSFRITGWAWGVKDRRLPSEIVVTSDGIITGLGTVGDFRPTDETPGTHATTNFIGFTGYVRDVQSSTRVEIYAVARKAKKSACYIATFAPE